MVRCFHFFAYACQVFGDSRVPFYDCCFLAVFCFACFVVHTLIIGCFLVRTGKAEIASSRSLRAKLHELEAGCAHVSPHRPTVRSRLCTPRPLPTPPPKKL